MSTPPFNPFKDDMAGRLLLGRYRIVRKLAAGGMGVVYLARFEGARGFAKPVVAKLILPGMSSDQSFLGMFVREARILSKLDDPGIVSAVDFAAENDFYVMVLEYVHGFQLREWLKYRAHIGKPLPGDVLIQLAINILEPLGHAHSIKESDGTVTEVVHRDISPSNVMLNTDGRVKLVDFGIARMNNMTGDYKTQTGAFKGKLSYSAPERFANQPLTVKCDIYSAGVTLHEMLLGHNEFYTGDHASTIARVLGHTASSVSLARSDVPVQIDDVLAKALDKNPANRYPTARAFADALRGLLSRPTHLINEDIEQLVAVDFNNEEMARYLKVEPLCAREQAWRNPSTVPASPIVADEESTVAGGGGVETNLIEPTNQATTVVEGGGTPVRPKGPAGREPSRPIALEIVTPSSQNAEQGGSGPFAEVVLRVRPVVAVLGLGAILLIVGLALGGWMMTRPSSTTSPQRFVVVKSAADGPAERDAASAAAKTIVKTVETEPVAEEQLSDTGSNVPATDDPQVSSRPSVQKKPTQADKLRRLTNAFRAKHQQINQCAANAEGRITLSIMFTVNPDGATQKVAVEPKAVGHSTVGQCIGQVAAATRFPAIGETLTFRIPLTIGTP